MAKQIINVGVTANDKKGDSLRVAFTKTNANFTDLYNQIGGLELDAVIPSQTGNAGKFLTTSGTNLSWATVSAGADTGVIRFANSTIYSNGGQNIIINPSNDGNNKIVIPGAGNGNSFDLLLANNEGTVTIKAGNTNQWKFNSDGTLISPNETTFTGSTIDTGTHNHPITLTTGEYVTIQPGSGSPVSKYFVFRPDGVLQLPKRTPISFTAVFDSGHFMGDTFPTLTGDPWSVTITFTLGSDGTYNISTSGVPNTNPGYVNNNSFRFTQTDHGITGYNLDVNISIISGTAEFQIGNPPAGDIFPALEFQDKTIQSTAWTGSVSSLVNGSNSVVLGSDGAVNLPQAPSAGAAVIQPNNNTFGLKLIVAGNSWTYSTGGGITFPNNSSFTGADFYAAPNTYIELASNDDNNFVGVQNDSVYIQTNYNNSLHQWIFGTDGSLKFPDQSSQTTAWTGVLPSPTYSGSSSIGNVTPAPLNLNNTGNAGQVKTQLNLINTAGNANTGSAIDFITYTGAGNGLPGARIQSIDDGNFSSNFEIALKGPGNNGNNDIKTFWTFGSNGSLSLPNGSTIRDLPDDSNPQGVYINVNSNLTQFDTGGRTHIPNDLVIKYGGITFVDTSYQTTAYLGTATTSQIGGVKPDGTSITISNGVISSASAFQPNGVFNIATTGGTTVLTSATAQNLTLTGSNTQTIQLPDATTLKNGWIFRINNNSSSASSLTVNNAGGGQVGTVPQGGDTQFILLDNTTTNGSWDYHGWIPSNLLMSSSVFQLGSGSYTISPYNSSLTIGTSTGGTTYNFGTGATLSGNTKTINIGTGGVSGSTTTITVGSASGTSTTAFNGTTTFNAAVKFNGTTTLGIVSTAQTAGNIVSAATIAPTNPITFVSGNTQINTITPPSGIATYGGWITLIPTGTWTTATGGNIALATTTVTNKALIMTYDAGTSKWYPSY